MNNQRLSVQAYMNMPYHLSIVHDTAEDGFEGWVAAVEELPGCLAQGRSAGEAAERIRDAMELYLSDLIASGDPVPAPFDEPACSGKVLLRLPKSLHQRLIDEARREGVSLNQLASGSLAAALSWRKSD